MKTKKAVARTTARYDKRQHHTYPKAKSQSSLKLEIGELLFCLQFPVAAELSHIGWGLLERRLRQRVDRIHAGGEI